MPVLTQCPAAQREKKPARREVLKEQLARVQQTLKRDGEARVQDKRVRASRFGCG